MSLIVEMRDLLAEYDLDDDLGELVGLCESAGYRVPEGINLAAMLASVKNDVLSDDEVDEGLIHRIKSAYKKIKAKLKHKKVHTGHTPKKFHAKPSASLWKPGRSREIAARMA